VCVCAPVLALEAALLAFPSLHFRAVGEPLSVAWGRHCSWAHTRHASAARGTSSDASERESRRYSQRLKQSLTESLARQTAGGVEVEMLTDADGC
jgi:hypothetical protein